MLIVKNLNDCDMLTRLSLESYYIIYFADYVNKRKNMSDILAVNIFVYEISKADIEFCFSSGQFDYKYKSLKILLIIY